MLSQLGVSQHHVAETTLQTTEVREAELGQVW
jgi:hypothetical protein